MRSLSFAIAVALTFSPALAVAEEVEAASESLADAAGDSFASPVDRFVGHGYGFASPFGFALIMGDDNLRRLATAAYRWEVEGGFVLDADALGLGGEGMESFVLAVGGMLEHTVTSAAVPFFGRADLHQVQIGGVARGGMVLDVIEAVPLFVYGKAGLGPAIGSWTFAGRSTNAIGFFFLFGGGAQIMIWEQLAIGFDVHFTLALDLFPDLSPDDVGVHLFQSSLFAGWYF